MADLWINIQNEPIQVDDSEEELLPTIPLTLAETVTIVEDISLELKCYLDISDSITVNESVSNLLPLLNISVSESISISEDVSGLLPELFLDFSEGISVSDVEELLLPALILSISDTVSIAEFTGRSLKIYIDISDSITLADRGWICHYLNISESIGVADTEEGLLPTLLLSIHDSITIGESTPSRLPKLYSDNYDEVSVTDVETEFIFPLVVFDNIYIRDIFVKAISDVGVTGIYNTIAATQIIFASAVRTAATYVSSSLKVASCIYLRFHFDITAENGAATLDTVLQTSPDNIKWYDVVTLDQIIATGQYSTVMTTPGVFVRAKCIVAGSGSPSFTFNAKLTKYMPVGCDRRLVLAGRR